MIIKRYLVNNMNEAMTRIRYELGKDAVIISQRKVRKPGLKGMFSPKVIEVTAAVENTQKSNNKQEQKEELTLENSLDSIKKIMEQEIELKRNVVDSHKREKVNTPELQVKNPNKNIQEQNTNNILMEEIISMKKMLTQAVNLREEEESKYADIRTKMLQNDFSIEIIDEICEALEQDKREISNEEKLREYLENSIETNKSNLEGPVVLVGPTGVGKTTTIAKLAGRMALFEKKKVGLITIDTYRIGAVEQLKTYAEIMNIPFKVVITIKEMEEAIKAMEGCDVVLIDTTGRSSKNSMQISELRAFVQKVKTENIYLVISAITKNKDIESIAEGFRELNYKNVIVTKLDETSNYGSLLTIMKKVKKPFSFFTVGQNVPEDIKYLNKNEIVSLILGEDSIC